MPKTFNKILCPVAFDRNLVAALKFAHEFTELDKSTLYLQEHLVMREDDILGVLEG